MSRFEQLLVYARFPECVEVPSLRVIEIRGTQIEGA